MSYLRHSIPAVSGEESLSLGAASEFGEPNLIERFRIQTSRFSLDEDDKAIDEVDLLSLITADGRNWPIKFQLRGLHHGPVTWTTEMLATKMLTTQ